MPRISTSEPQVADFNLQLHFLFVAGSDTSMLAERGSYRFSIRNDGDAEDHHLSAGACLNAVGSLSLIMTQISSHQSLMEVRRISLAPTFFFAMQ
jgi:hypothetical protein